MMVVPPAAVKMPSRRLARIKEDAMGAATNNKVKKTATTTANIFGEPNRKYIAANKTAKRTSNQRNRLKKRAVSERRISTGMLRSCICRLTIELRCAVDWRPVCRRKLGDRLPRHLE